jgi:hypothetical protein
MSSPDRKFPLMSAVMLGVLPLCAFAFEPPAPNEPIPAATALARSAPAPDTLSALACTVCDFRPTLDLLLKPPASLHAEFVESATSDIESRDALPQHLGTSLGAASPSRVESLATLQFRDNEPLINRLKRVQAWPLLTLWDSSAATLYLGLDKHGEPGVHLRQKRSDRGSVLPRSGFVLIASPEAPSENVTPEVTDSKR